MLNTHEKTKIIGKFSSDSKDTGSASVQVALLTEEIKRLVLHLKKHAKDNHSRRGLLKMVSKRKRLLGYLKDNNESKYSELIKKLGLRK